MGIALFDFSLFTIVVSVGLVAVALTNPSPVAPETAWDGIEVNALTPPAPVFTAELLPGMNRGVGRLIGKQSRAAADESVSLPAAVDTNLPLSGPGWGTK